MIARPPRNEVNVTVRYSLTGNFPTVDSHLKARYGRVGFANKGACFRNQPLTRT